MAKKIRKNTVARQSNGEIQVTFSIPWATVEKEREHVGKEMAENITVPGFRKGKAPLSQAIKRIPQEQLIEHTLSHILPGKFAEVIKEEDLKPAIYPKFSLVSAKEGEDWEVMAKTCELPDFKVGEYKKYLKPKKTKKAEKLSVEEKQNKVIEALLGNVKFEIPEMIIEEEVNSRLASLLERLEKLGLSLESYLASVNKSAPALREEYSDQAEKAIRLDLILQDISKKEKIEITKKEIEDYMKVSSMSPEQENTIRLFLMKRKTLDKLAKLY